MLKNNILPPITVKAILRFRGRPSMICPPRIDWKAWKSVARLCCQRKKKKKITFVQKREKMDPEACCFCSSREMWTLVGKLEKGGILKLLVFVRKREIVNGYVAFCLLCREIWRVFKCWKRSLFIVSLLCFSTWGYECPEDRYSLMADKKYNQTNALALEECCFLFLVAIFLRG